MSCINCDGVCIIIPVCSATCDVKSLVFKLSNLSALANKADARIGASFSSIILQNCKNCP
jgi:hypothetical protein